MKVVARLLGQGILLLTLSTTVFTQQPCEPLRLNQNPSYNVELTEADILPANAASTNLYRDQIEIVGRIGGRFQNSVTMTFRRQDMVNPKTELNQIQANPDAYFVLENYNSGIYIRMIRGIDRDGPTDSIDDRVDFINLYIICKPLVARSSEVILNVLVKMKNINDNAPVFVGVPYSVNVSESMPIDTVIFTDIAATDRDNDNVDFSIIHAHPLRKVMDGYSSFRIDLPRIGSVLVNSLLDYEDLRYTHNTNQFYVQLMGVDTGTPAKTVYTSLLVNIMDDDDLGPMFVYDGCHEYDRWFPVCTNPQYRANVLANARDVDLVVYPQDDRSLPAVPIIARDQDTLAAPIAFTIGESMSPIHM